MKGIYLLLGSNLGDSQAMLIEASELIVGSIGKIVKIEGPVTFQQRIQL